MSIMLILVAIVGFVIFLGGSALLAMAIYHVRKEALEHRRQEQALDHHDRMAA
jgi:hypothetical protein